MADWFPDPTGAASLIEQLANRMAGMYADAEERLLRAIMVDLKAGMVREGSVETRLQLTALRARAQEIVKGLDAAMPELAAEIVDRAARDGAQSIIDLLDGLGRPSMVAMPGFMAGGNAAMLALVDMVTALDKVHMRILRYPDDVYRAAVGKHVTNTLLGLETNRVTEQKVWRDLLNQGVTGFTDKSGRRWQLSTYVEMATRTATHRAFQDSRTNSMTNFGLDLVSIVIGRAACKRCARWGGKVLCIKGKPGVQKVQHAIQDNVYVTVNVSATLEQARAEGLFHPNCGCQTVAYFPGLDMPGDFTTYNEEANQAKEAQRAAEREIRKQKRELVTAFSPEQEREARRLIRAEQGKIRDLVDETPGIARRRYREQLNMAYKRATP